jgi:ATP-dependent Clp protease ATP-binding subunit ClpA
VRRLGVSYGACVLESYSSGVERVVSFAMIEARGLEHSRIGTEHLMLGLLADHDEPSAEALRAAGASLAAARHKVAEVLGAVRDEPNDEELPLTSRAQRALGRAGRFSREQRAPEVTAGHVLLGVLDVEGLACQVLRGLNVDIAQLRSVIATSRTPVAGVGAGVVDTSDDAGPARHRIVAGEHSSVSPHCPACRAMLEDNVTEMVITARREGSTPTRVSVVFCAACGVTLGVLRPESS